MYLEMKVGIVTPYDADNMGAILQSTALKNYLIQKGHEPYFVNYRNKKAIDQSFKKNSCEIDKGFLIKYWPRFFIHPIQNIRSFSYYISLVRHIFWNKQRKKMFYEYLSKCNVMDEGDYADLYILGSDEIWNIKSPLFHNPLFWGIGLKPVVSYAASVSNSTLEDYNDYSYLTNGLSNLDFISVRDAYSRDIVHNFVSSEIEIVLDPTLLCAKLRDTTEKEQQWLVLYGYRFSWYGIEPFIRKFADEKNLKIVCVWFQQDFADENIVCLPEQFSETLAQAKYILTSTFHGSIFSIINRKKFASLEPSTKTRELLKQFDLYERAIFYSSSYEKFRSVFDQPIDYENVEVKLKDQQEHSKRVFNTILEKYG